jgi:hypothetical protein
MSKTNGKLKYIIPMILLTVLVFSGCDKNENSNSLKSQVKVKEKSDKVVGEEKKDDKQVVVEDVIESRCEDASDYIVKKLEGGFNAEGITLRNAKVVKSNDFESVYFISADLQGSGLEGEDNIATFTTNKMDYSGLILSINHVAEEFAVWPLGSKTDANIAMSDDGAKESQDCVNK